jgi:hypothetical protein
MHVHNKGPLSKYTKRQLDHENPELLVILIDVSLSLSQWMSPAGP